MSEDGVQNGGMENYRERRGEEREGRIIGRRGKEREEKEKGGEERREVNTV